MLGKVASTGILMKITPRDMSMGDVLSGFEKWCTQCKRLPLYCRCEGGSGAGCVLWWGLQDGEKTSWPSARQYTRCTSLLNEL